MKVIVRCANNRVTKADMEREIERLFQENKDLRVQVGHLHDELANAKASVEIQRGFREEMAEEIEALKKELAESQSESSQSLNAIVDIWKKAVEEKVKAEERAEEYRIALMESDCRVDELEKQLAWVREEVARLTYERDTAVNGNAELIEENAELRDNLDAVINIKNEYAETIDEMRKKIVAAQSPEFTAHLAKLIIANLPSIDK